MSTAFMEIRYLAHTAKTKDDPAETLERIRLLADACHNLPGVIGRRPPAPGDVDPFIGPWRNPREHGWMARVLQSTGLNTAWLDAAPWWPPSVRAAERPRLARRGIRWPRSLSEYRSVDATVLGKLVDEGLESLSPPKARQAFLRSVIAHAAPDGHQLVRAIRPGERPALACEEVTEVRCVMRMKDQDIIAFRLELPARTLAVLPRRLSPVRQLWLASSTPRRHERDAYLWDRAHQAAVPDCPLCAGRP